ncbi:MAG: SprT family zinc-dependent metalloprotease, partial [Eubacteriales bacterium]
EEQKKRKPRETEFVDGENLKFQGDDFLLQVLEYDGKTTKAALKGDRFVVHLNRGLLLDTRREEVQAKLEQLYRDKAREAVLERLEYFKSKLGVDYNGLRIKDQKTRWGSCSKNGNLNFNWKIVIAPSDIIDYIVVHELCHLLHMNHSKEFWETVASQIPGYKDKKRWLKENGPGLKL